MPFKFDSNYVFLTYPQASFNHNELHGFINSVCPTEWCRICTELHTDGNPHCHVVAKFTKRFQSRNERIFDFGERHPNIQPVRSVPKALHYVSKDGEFTDFGTIPSGGTKRSAEEALSLAGDPDESKYLRACLEARVPYQYAKRLRELANSEASVIDSLYIALLEWECAALRQQILPENKCAVLVGPTGCGKSAWAKRVAPKPALWVTEINDLKHFSAAYHKSIIFDDMSFTHWPLVSQIHIVDLTDDRSIRVLFGKVKIPKGTCKIFTCNKYPFTVDDKVTAQAIQRRIEFINLF